MLYSAEIAAANVPLCLNAIAARISCKYEVIQDSSGGGGRRRRNGRVVQSENKNTHGVPIHAA